jgi:hypothetical protein
MQRERRKENHLLSASSAADFAHNVGFCCCPRQREVLDARQNPWSIRRETGGGRQTGPILKLEGRHQLLPSLVAFRATVLS